MGWRGGVGDVGASHSWHTAASANRAQELRGDVVDPPRGSIHLLQKQSGRPF